MILHQHQYLCILINKKDNIREDNMHNKTIKAIKILFMVFVFFFVCGCEEKSNETNVGGDNINIEGESNNITITTLAENTSTNQ